MSPRLMSPKSVWLVWMQWWDVAGVVEVGGGGSWLLVQHVPSVCQRLLQLHLGYHSQDGNSSGDGNSLSSNLRGNALNCFFFCFFFSDRELWNAAALRVRQTCELSWGWL